LIAFVFILLIALALFSIFSILRFNKVEFSGQPIQMFNFFLIGLVANFLDTLGIGSFTIATSLFRITKFFKNSRLLPGTLNIMNGLPTIVEALFFVKVVKVDALTFFSLIVASMFGSFLGSKIITKLDAKKMKIVMGIAMFITSTLMILKKVGVIEFLGQGNTALGLTGIALVIGIIGNCIFGALMSAGVGLYAPCMVMVYLLGMKPIAAFPIMMTSSAALIPVNTVTFSKEHMFYNKDLWLAIVGGIIGVIIATLFVKGMSMDILTWIIIVIGFYTALSLLRSAAVGER